MVFWRDTKTLWSSQGQSSKADGVNKWAFVFSFPKEAEINSTSKDYKTKHLLPPTFSERASPAYIDYKLSVTIKRSFLRVNQTCVVYSPFFKNYLNHRWQFGDKHCLRSPTHCSFPITLKNNCISWWKSAVRARDRSRRMVYSTIHRTLGDTLWYKNSKSTSNGTLYSE